jgi:predicted DNA-binding protein
MPEAERKKNLIAVRLTDEKMAALTKISDQEGLPISYFVREGIELVIKRYSRKR